MNTDAPAPLLIANLGAEESGPDPSPAARRAAETAARLWQLLFARGAGRAGEEPPDWPAALGPPPEGAAFPWLERRSAAFAWLVTEAAEAEAARRGVVLEGAASAVVRRVHDKAFAFEVALAEGLVPHSLRGALRVLSPEELAGPEAARAAIASALSDWPAWLGRRGDGASPRRAILKPRRGSSGRGRVAFEDARSPDLAGALSRLREAGGAILEPWLERQRDLSAQLHLDPGGDLLLLGTLEQRLSVAGVPRGLRGTLDRRGRVTSGSAWDEQLREAAVAVAVAARDAGFHGPCGVDGFVFAGPDGEPELRPVVELNARFTLGTVAVGLARRALHLVRDDFDLDANERLWFELDLGSSPRAADPDLRILDLGGAAEGPRPALLLARHPDALG